jgi:hypothetical protein
MPDKADAQLILKRDRSLRSYQNRNLNDWHEALFKSVDAIRELRDTLQMARIEYHDTIIDNYEVTPAGDALILHEIDAILDKYDETVPNDLTPEQQNVKNQEDTDE